MLKFMQLSSVLISAAALYAGGADWRVEGNTSVSGVIAVNSLYVPPQAALVATGNLTIESAGNIVIDGLVRGADNSGQQPSPHAPRIILRAAGVIEINGEVVGGNGAAAVPGDAAMMALSPGHTRNNAGGNGGDIILDAPVVLAANNVYAGAGGAGNLQQPGGRGGAIIVNGYALAKEREFVPTFVGGDGGKGGAGLPGQAGAPGGDGGAVIVINPGEDRLALTAELAEQAPELAALAYELEHRGGGRMRDVGDGDIEGGGGNPGTGGAPGAVGGTGGDAAEVAAPHEIIDGVAGGACQNGQNGRNSVNVAGGQGGEGGAGGNSPVAGQAPGNGGPGGRGGKATAGDASNGGAGGQCCSPPGRGGKGGNGGTPGQARGGKGGKGGTGGTGVQVPGGTGGNGGTGGDAIGAVGGNGNNGGNGEPPGAKGDAGGKGTVSKGVKGEAGDAGAGTPAGRKGNPGLEGGTIQGNAGTPGNPGGPCPKPRQGEQPRGTQSPPGSQGSYVPRSFNPDGRPIGQLVSGVSSPLGGVVQFSRPLFHQRVDQGWPGWSHGYFGDVYVLPGTSTQLDFILPEGIGAFIFYAQPQFGTHPISVSVNGRPPLVQTASAEDGAVGYVLTAGPGQQLRFVQIQSPAPFAIGEFLVDHVRGVLGEPLLPEASLPDLIVPRGGAAEWAVEPSGLPPFTFEWYYADERIEGASGPVLTLSDVQPQDAGVYYVRVTNDVGTTTSRLATLDLVDCPAQPFATVTQSTGRMLDLSAQGAAQLFTCDSGVLVSPITDSGDDGVDLDFEPLEALRVEFFYPGSEPFLGTPYWFRAGGVGTLDRDLGEDLGHLQIEIELVQLQLTSVMAPVGSETLQAVIYDNGALVTRAVLPGGIIGTFDVWPSSVQFGHFDIAVDQTLRWRAPTLIRLSDGQQVVGDELRLIALNPLRHFESLERLELSAAGVGPIHITSMIVTPPRDLGDMNCDGRVDFNDINGFIAALVSREEFYRQYPDCNYDNADTNEDGVVDFDDIESFIDRLVRS